MNISFFGFCIFLFLIAYLFTILFQKQQLSLLGQLEKAIFHEKIKVDSSFYKVEIILYLIFILLIGWGLFLSIYLQYFRYWFYYYSTLISKCSIAIFFFIFGLLFAQGKNVIYYYFHSYLSFIRSLLLSGVLFLLILLSYQFNSFLSIFLYLLHFLFTIHYFKFFNTRKQEMKSSSFLLQFFWLLFMGFIDSFSIIFLIFHL